MRFVHVLAVWVCYVLASACSPAVKADALANPPQYLRSNRVVAGSAAATITLDITPTVFGTPSPATKRCQSFVVETESTTTGDDVYINIEGTATATDSVNGTNTRVYAGRPKSFDCRASSISYIRAGTNNVTITITSVY